MSYRIPLMNIMRILRKTNLSINQSIEKYKISSRKLNRGIILRSTSTNCFYKKIDRFKVTNYNIINNLIYKRLYEINKFVIKLNNVFDLINKFDDTTFYKNNNVIDLQYVCQLN